MDDTDSFNAQRIALQRITLRELNPNLSNVLIVGIIIGKSRPRKFLDNKAPVKTFKAVWNFTIRDSKSDYINISYWGASETIYQANDKFRTGDVVEVVNPKISVRTWNDRNEPFRPKVTSPYTLTLNEKSSLNRHDGPTENFICLLRFSTKPIAGYFPLRDVHTRGASLKGTSVDLLVVVKGLGQIRTVSSKNNESLQVRTAEVFDHTCLSLRIEIWEPDIIQRSESWKPRITILFMTDLQIFWSNYNKQFIAKVTSRTIVTENPQGKEVQNLSNYASTAPIEISEIVDQMITTFPDVSTIQDVMSVKQVQDKINALLQENKLGTRQFTALLFAFVSSFDLDGLSRTLLSKCGQCKMLLKSSKCENVECPTVYDKKIIDPEIKFDIKIQLTDHTGTLINCRFSGKSVEEALECTAYEFANMSDDKKCQLKWKYLLQRCSVYIAVLFIGRQKPVISILQINLASDYEVCRRLPVY